MKKEKTFKTTSVWVLELPPKKPYNKNSDWNKFKHLFSHSWGEWTLMATKLRDPDYFWFTRECEMCGEKDSKYIEKFKLE